MALAQYRIGGFRGIHQGISENALDGGSSPDACNMDTGGGDLSVAKGYVRHIDAPIPEAQKLRRLFVWNRADGRRFVAASGGTLYAAIEGDAAWTTIYTFAADEADPARYDFLVCKIADTEALLVSAGNAQIVKWTGDTAVAATLFGSAEGLSDVHAAYLELYYNRLFAAGDAAHPSRLYWSQAPGGARSIEDWSSAEESENVSGGHVEIGADSDPITGLVALSNQLVIFKRDSVYRLLGDRPDNYRILPLNAAMRQPVHTSIVRYGDALYFLTDGGMYCYDGQSVRRQGDSDKARTFLLLANMEKCVSATCRDKLYFAVREHTESGANDAVLVYDLTRGTYMVRRGFLARDLSCAGGTLYLADGGGHVCRFGEGDTYAGAAIEAYWNTPLTDLDMKLSNKKLMEMYVRGTGGLAAFEAVTASGTAYFTRTMPKSEEEILEIPLTGDGRAFKLRISNVGGSSFSIRGGVELLLDMQRRIL